FQIAARLAHLTNARSRLRCLRTKTGNASSALRPFASQDHLVGKSFVSAFGRPSQGSGLTILTQPYDELAPLHSITSSARPRSVSGTVRPNALAVLRVDD